MECGLPQEVDEHAIPARLKSCPVVFAEFHACAVHPLWCKEYLPLPASSLLYSILHNSLQRVRSPRCITRFVCCGSRHVPYLPPYFQSLKLTSLPYQSRRPEVWSAGEAATSTPSSISLASFPCTAPHAFGCSSSPMNFPHLSLIGGRLSACSLFLVGSCPCLSHPTPPFSFTFFLFPFPPGKFLQSLLFYASSHAPPFYLLNLSRLLLIINDCSLPPPPPSSLCPSKCIQPHLPYL